MPSDLDVVRSLPTTKPLRGWDPTAHVVDDLFENKLAFVALLNFPLTTLEERTAQGPRGRGASGPRRSSPNGFRQRVPARRSTAAPGGLRGRSRYIADYNIWMHHLVDAKGQRLFPPGSACSRTGTCATSSRPTTPTGRTASRSSARSQQVMERIVAQTIPAVVIDNPYRGLEPRHQRGDGVDCER